jgi:hypothetical protein
LETNGSPNRNSQNFKVGQKSGKSSDLHLTFFQNQEKIQEWLNEYYQSKIDSMSLSNFDNEPEEVTDPEFTDDFSQGKKSPKKQI